MTTARKSSADLRAQVGQLLIMGFDGLEAAGKLGTTINTLQPAGVILFMRNCESIAQTHKLVRDCQSLMKTPPFLCVDMEGGTVDRLKKIVAPVPAAAEVFASGNRKLYRKHGALLGREVRAFGFNVDFAPVSDLAFEPSKSVLTSRVVSPDPKQTIVYVKEFLLGLNSAGVLGCGKHFPGLGEASQDTHFSLPAIKKSLERMWQEDLLPYRALHRKFPFVMVGHASYPQVTGDSKPASISKKWITDVLRKKIGYRGLILSDDLEMGGAQAAASVEDAAMEAIRAGADMYLMCHNEEFVWRSYEAVLKEAERDRRFAQRVAEAAQHVLAFKKKCSRLKRRAPAPTEKVINKLRREIWELAEEARMEQHAAVLESEL